MHFFIFLFCFELEAVLQAPLQEQGIPNRDKDKWWMWECQAVSVAEEKYVDFVGYQCCSFKRSFFEFTSAQCPWGQYLDLSTVNLSNPKRFYFCDINSIDLHIKQCGIQNFLPTKEEASFECFEPHRRESASRNSEESASMCDHLSFEVFGKFTIISTGVGEFIKIPLF